MAERPEEPEATIDTTVDQPSPAAMALALGRTSRGKAVRPLDRKAEAFLDEQTDLIRLQKEHLHEQRALILSRLRWGRFSDRMRALLQSLGVILGAAIVIGLGVLAWRAHADHGLLIEAFSAPPSFAERGIGGDVVAADIVNKLSAIVAVVRSDSVSSTNGASQDTSDDVKIEIPDTGVSLTEVWRAMRDWLGSERKVSGGLRESADNAITLTARLEGGQVFTATGAPADLDELEQQIAEKLYAATDPTNIATYLAFEGRWEEALAAAAQKVATARNSEDRADAFALWAQMSGPARIQELSRIALSIDPGLLIGHANLAYEDLELGHDEAALAEVRGMLTLKDADQPVQHRGRGASGLRAYARDTIATLTGDYADSRRDMAPADRNPAIHVDAVNPSSLLAPADADARLHDPMAAMALLSQVTAITSASSPDLLTTRYDIGAARVDWTAGLRDAEALNAAADKGGATSGDPKATCPARLTCTTATKTSAMAWSTMDVQTRYQPMLAEAKAHAGDLKGAETLIAASPLDCYDCLRTRGRIAALSDDWAGADRWFAEAARQGPSLPFAYADWAEALLSRGDAVGAIAKLELAHQKGPHFADPLELWGEALMAKRDYTDAIKKFAEADKDAPKWGRNHLRWGEALMLSGRYAEARAQFETANGLDLSKPGRAALNVLLARTSSGPLHG